MTNSGRRQIEWDGGKSVERVLSNGKRRYTAAFKAWIVEQCLRPGVSLAGIALANGLNANLVRKWVGNRAGVPAAPAQLLPVRIEPNLATVPQREGGLIPDGHLKLPHLWPGKLLQAGRGDCRSFSAFS